jgi:hypothetical protein
MIYGKIFTKMYAGSMVGAGLGVFALMPYVISAMRPDKDREEYVTLNPDLLAAVFGTTPEVMIKAIEYLCAPDTRTTTPGEEGRRLVRVEPFLYRVVNGKYYREIMDEEDRRLKAAKRQAEFRSRKAVKKARKGKPLPGEKAYVAGVENGTIDPETHHGI